MKNFGKNGAWAYPETAQFFRVPPIISGTGKVTDFKFRMHIYRLNRNKSPWKFLGKVAMGVVRDTGKFSGHPYMRCIARSSLRQLSFLVELDLQKYRPTSMVAIAGNATIFNIKIPIANCKSRVFDHCRLQCALCAQRKCTRYLT